MAQQLSHNTIPFEQKLFPIHLLCDGMESPANMGSLFRIAEAFGVAHISFGGTNVPIESARLRRTSRSTYKNMAYTEVTNLRSVAINLKEQGFTLIALEITETSKPLQQFTTSNKQKIALVLGNEKHGVSPELLDACEHHLHITMYGANSSMNVVQATAIALYALTKH